MLRAMKKVSMTSGMSMRVNIQSPMQVAMTKPA